MGETREVRVIETSTGEVVRTMQMSDKGLDGLYRRIDWDRFHVEGDED